MGHGVALNLLKHQYRLTLFNHPGNQPTHDLLAMGARLTDSLEELAIASDVLLLCVTGSAQIESLLSHDQGIAKYLRAGMTIIDLSTALPQSTKRLAEALKPRSVELIDAAMTRTHKEAAEGRLNLLVGCNAESFTRIRPLLQCIAENITHCGPVGSGHQMKLLHNYVSLGSVSLIAEAAACASLGGVSMEVFTQVLATGGGAGTALERIRPYLLNGDASGLKFTINNAAKDLGYYQQMASEQHAEHVIADGVFSTLKRVVAEGRGDAFVPELKGVLDARSKKS